jgi:hypothetical protein
MAPIQNIRITSATQVRLNVSLCSANTTLLAMTAYPVFSASTTDGTSTYGANTPLLRLSPATATVAASTPSVSTSTSAGAATATLTFGTSFDAATNEWQSGGSARRYQYILHASSHTPATSYSAAVTSHTAVALSGQIDLAIAATSPTPAISVCSVSVR